MLHFFWDTLYVYFDSPFQIPFAFAFLFFAVFFVVRYNMIFVETSAKDNTRVEQVTKLILKITYF